MSTEPATPPAWPVLSAHERRILGVLVEKAQTTQGGSPLSLNSLATGCNQKSNRDPLMNLSDLEVEEALATAQKKGLVTKIIGGRVEHWKHSLYDAWRVSKVELAILGELLLRGAQTEGELRARACRMEPIADVEALRAILKPLAERRLVVYLTQESRRGTVVTHGFHAPQELERLRTKHVAEAEAAETAAPMVANARPALDEVHAEIAALKTLVNDLQAKLTALTEQVRTIKEGLGL
jgi:uncharacterized protein YceH (UPF0502 family)